MRWLCLVLEVHPVVGLALGLEMVHCLGLLATCLRFILVK